jgi:hypothetical protein
MMRGTNALSVPGVACFPKVRAHFITAARYVAGNVLPPNRTSLARGIATRARLRAHSTRLTRTADNGRGMRSEPLRKRGHSRYK